MSAVRFGTFQFGLVLATALPVMVTPTASRAYTPEQQQACTGDAFRLCNSDIPDVDRVTVCMIRNRAQLSPGCRVYFRSSEPAAVVRPVAAGRPLSIRPKTPQKPISAKPRKPRKPAKPATA